MSGYGPFSWSYGLSVLKTIAEPTWHYDRLGATEKDLTWEPRDKHQHLRPNLPFATYIGWALLRIALCIDIALINELVGYFVLAAVRYKGYSFNTHRDPSAVAFIGAIGGAISTVLVFLIDLIYSRPERRERWPMIDPNRTYITKSADLPIDPKEKSEAKKAREEAAAPALKNTLEGQLTEGLTFRTVGGNDLNLAMQGDAKDAKNMTEGGPITLAKLKTHALMRIVIWVAAACAAGASGTAIWFVKDGKKTVNRFEDRVITGIIVQLVGVSVIVVGPSLLQLMSLLFESAETRVVQQKRPLLARS